MLQTLPVTGNTQRTQPENRVHYPSLDGYRAVAFLLVFFHHYCYLPWGWSGVSFFFVLSGFLITGILVDTRDTPHRFRNFYVRRTLRIFPLYWGVFLALLLSTPIFRWQWSLSWLTWPLYVGNYLQFVSPSAIQTGSPLQSAALAVLTSGRVQSVFLLFGHCWSLCVEEQFYLLWPCLIFFVRRSRMLILCAVIIAGLPILRMILNNTLPPWMIHQDLLYRTSPFQLDSLILGALLAFLWRSSHRELLLRLSRIVLPIALTAAIVYVGIGMLRGGNHPFSNYVQPAWEYTWGLTFINVLGAALMLRALQPSSLSARLFHLRPMRWLGRISYGAYVFHYMLYALYLSVAKRVMMLFGKPQEQATQIGLQHLWIPALLCTLLISWLSFRFWESPFLNLKERWTISSRPSVEQSV